LDASCEIIAENVTISLPGNSRESYPEKFTENVFPGITDMTEAFFSAHATGKVVRLRDTVYKVTSLPVLQSGDVFLGSGSARTFIHYSGQDAAWQSDPNGVADNATLKGFYLWNKNAGTVGFDLGTVRELNMDDVIAGYFSDVNFKFVRPINLGNYYNRISNVISNNNKSVNPASIGFLFGGVYNAAANKISNVEDYNSATGLKLVNAQGIEISGYNGRLNDNTLILEGSQGNKINVYSEASTFVGSADVNSIGNFINIVNDGSGNFADNGWNKVEGGAVVAGYAGQPLPLKQHVNNALHRVHIYRTTGETFDVFKITLPGNGSVTVTTCVSGSIATINNYAGIQKWKITRKAGGTPNVSIVDSFDDNQWDSVIPDSEGNVTFTIKGDLVNNATYNIDVDIFGGGVDPESSLPQFMALKDLINT
jgi:hypothetical protein